MEIIQSCDNAKDVELALKEKFDLTDFSKSERVKRVEQLKSLKEELQSWEEQ